MTAATRWDTPLRAPILGAHGPSAAIPGRRASDRVTGMSDGDDIRAAARARIKARNDFKVMLAIFAVITLLLLAIWFFTSGPGSYFWPVWPIIGMALAAIFAGLDAFGVTRRYITESDIDAEVAKMQGRRTDDVP